MSEKHLLFSISIKDCEIETFTCGGNGGQHRNSTQSGIRIRHMPSGAVGEGREERKQGQNKQSAFLKMANHPKIRQWIKIEAARRMGEPSIEDRVDEQMRKSNLKIDVKDENGNWITEKINKNK